jgi:hypothetical protein
MNHYGKKIDELSELENELLMIDVMMLRTFERMVTDDDNISSIMMGAHLSEMRMVKCKELLGEVTQEEVEESVYSFLRFMRDKKSNEKIFSSEKKEVEFNWN